jgi:hypothetical protein
MNKLIVNLFRFCLGSDLTNELFTGSLSVWSHVVAVPEAIWFVVTVGLFNTCRCRTVKSLSLSIKGKTDGIDWYFEKKFGESTIDISRWMPVVDK